MRNRLRCVPVLAARLCLLVVLVACGGGRAETARPAPGARPPSELSAGQVRDLHDRRLGPALAQLGIYHAGMYVRSASPGLHLLEPYDASRTPVVLVHGYGGHPQQLEPLIAGIDDSRFQLWVFQYPSGWRLERSARAFDAALETLRARLRFDQVHIVAHSMGGLVARGMLAQRARRDATPCVATLLTLASPLGGMPSAAEGARKSPMVIASWLDLDPESAFVARLGGAPLPDGTRWVLVTADDGGGEGDGTVSLTHQLPPSSADDADRVVAVRATHTSVLGHGKVHATLDEVLTARGRLVRMPTHVQESYGIKGPASGGQLAWPVGRRGRGR